VEYEVVKKDWLGDRANTVVLTGQKELSDMAETIRSGRLNEKRGAGSAGDSDQQ